MDILAALNDIIAYLQANIATVEVKNFPIDFSKIKSLHSNGTICVRYSGSTYETPEPKRTKQVVQIRNAMWEVAIGHRNLVKEDGVYALIESVRNLLTGYTVNSMTHSSVLVPVKDGFISREGAIWIYGIEFTHSVKWETVGFK